jgi:hypothetical protein
MASAARGELPGNPCQISHHLSPRQLCIPSVAECRLWTSATLAYAYLKKSVYLAVDSEQASLLLKSMGDGGQERQEHRQQGCHESPLVAAQCAARV